MKATFYRSPDGTLTSPVDDAAVKRIVASGEGALWVDFEGTSREEAGLLSDVFRFHDLTIDDCFNRHVDPAKIDDYGRYLFIIAQAMRYDARSTRLQTTELDLFLGPNFVVSFHQEALPSVDELRRRCREDGPEFARGADFLAHSLLDALVDDYQPVVEQLEETLERLEERVLEQPQPQRNILEEVLLLKRNVQRLRRTIIPQRDVVNRIARGEFPQVVRPESHVYFRDIYDHVVRVEQLAESVRDLGDGVLNTYLSAVNNRMNEVMKTLSVVATILLPLTFIASIYGMTFENMPELGWEWGYYGILGAMLAISIGLVLFFRLRKWF
ncbi:MAG: magnesium/cobalt transporter CorA [Dehalococcoidia bacterium]|nr:magnesium/cobalt transporter CorA [Dehalococcoidia bacterium]